MNSGAEQTTQKFQWLSSAEYILVLTQLDGHRPAANPIQFNKVAFSL